MVAGFVLLTSVAAVNLLTDSVFIASRKASYCALTDGGVSGWAEFAGALAGHSSLGSALTMRGVQAARPSLYDLTDELAKVSTPVLVLVGDEDEGCLEPALMLKRTIPTAGLAVLPPTGHTANLEEPDVFNRAVDAFLSGVARGS
jgi:pimeloyl-ACP methyl ester carboxylesterase